MANENSIQLKTRTIIWTVAVILLFVIAIICLNSFDNKRKFTQFKSINETVNTSEYPARLANLLEAFSKDDSLVPIKIQETLSQMENEFENISSCELYLPDSNAYIEFCANYNDNDNSLNFSKKEFKRFREVHYLPKEITILKDCIDKQSNVDLEVLFSAVKKDKKFIYTVIKVGNGYLFVMETRD